MNRSAIERRSNPGDRNDDRRSDRPRELERRVAVHVARGRASRAAAEAGDREDERGLHHDEDDDAPGSRRQQTSCRNMGYGTEPHQDRTNDHPPRTLQAWPNGRITHAIKPPTRLRIQR